MDDRRLVTERVNCLSAEQVLEKFWDARGKIREAVDTGEGLVARFRLELCKTISLWEQWVI